MDRNHWTIFKEGQKRIIPTKFGQNPSSSLGAIADSRWQTSNDHNSSPWANGSGELKKLNITCKLSAGQRQAEDSPEISSPIIIKNEDIT